MKLATWNVNSILARLPHVIRWLEAAQPDVLCIQETKCADEKFPTLDFKAIGYDCVIFGQQSYNGVAILSKGVCASVQRGYAGDDGSAHSRLLAVDVAGIRVINVYIPNGQVVGSEKYRYKLDWMKRLRDLLDQNYDPTTPVLLCGDFNIAPEDFVATWGCASITSGFQRRWLRAARIPGSTKSRAAGSDHPITRRLWP